jgi:hypothetical protein
MEWDNSGGSLKVGDRVLVLGSGYKKPKLIVEYRGPLGPKGARIYRVRLRRKPSPAYAEFREDQLQLVSRKDAAAPEYPEQT